MQFRLYDSKYTTRVQEACLSTDMSITGLYDILFGKANPYIYASVEVQECLFQGLYFN